MIASLLPVNDWRLSSSCEFRFRSCNVLGIDWAIDLVIDGVRRARLVTMSCAPARTDMRTFGIGAISVD